MRTPNYSQGKKLILKGIKTEKGRETFTKEYGTTTADCRNYSLKEKCCKNLNYKKLKHSVDKPYYDEAYKLLNTKKGKRKMRMQKAVVEPVWETLLHFRRLKKVYTKVNDLANKQVLMASAAYNLKKLMGFEAIKSAANVFKITATDLKLTIFNKISQFYEFILFFLNHRKLRIYYC